MSTDLNSFIDRISSHNSTTWFHNLKFDGTFILFWLLTHGYEYRPHGGPNQVGTFKCLIDGMGKFFSITVRWNNGHTTEFRDSVKKLPMTVRRVATSFKMEEGKGDIDYDKPRPAGYVPTAEEWDYLRRDVTIVATAMAQVIANGMTKLTVASDAMTEYKRLVNSKSFQLAFPVLSPELDAEIRRAYRGGFTYRDPRFGGCITRSGIVLDVNSLYPSIMMNRILPYGEPQFVDGKVDPTKERPLTVFSITFTAKIKPDHIPCIQIKGSSMFGETEYLTDISEPTTLMMTNVDFDLYNDHYDINVIAYGGGWRFKATRGMFDTYIQKWAKVKENSVGGQREIAKLFMNGLYGKFATNPTVTGKYPVLEDGAVRLKSAPDETRDPVYTPVGVFITSFARDLTIRAAQANYATFAYADTDSLHLLQDHEPEDIEVHPTKMGAWKVEYHFDSAYYIRPKAYLERKIDKKAHVCVEPCNASHHFVTHIAGLPEKVAEHLTFEDLRPGNILRGKLQPKSVPGGVVLVDVPFELKL